MGLHTWRHVYTCVPMTLPRLVRIPTELVIITVKPRRGLFLLNGCELFARYVMDHSELEQGLGLFCSVPQASESEVF